MAKITITVNDTHKDGEEVVGFRMDVDREGGPEGAAGITDAMLVTAVISRLWRSKTLQHMIPVTCSDLMRMRAQAQGVVSAPAVQKESPAAAPDLEKPVVVPLPGGKSVPLEAMPAPAPAAQEPVPAA